MCVAIYFVAEKDGCINDILAVIDGVEKILRHEIVRPSVINFVRNFFTFISSMSVCKLIVLENTSKVTDSNKIVVQTLRYRLTCSISYVQY